MDFVSIIDIAVAVYSIALGIIVYQRDTRNEVNQYFGVFCGLTAFCAFTDSLINNAATETEMYYLLHMIGVRMLLFTLLLHFFIIYSGNVTLRKWWFLLPCYLITLFFIIYPEPGEIFVVKRIEGLHSWGFWARDNGVFNLMMFVWIAAQISFINIWGIRMVFRERRKRKQVQSIYVLAGILISLFLPVLSDIFIPLTGMKTPQLATIPFALGNLVIGYGVIKHGLFSFKPGELTRDILNNISDSVIITDMAGKISFINSSGRLITGMSEQALLDTDINRLFDIPVCDDTIGTSAFPSANILHTGTKERQVIISFSSSTGVLPGIKEKLFVIHDVSDLHQSINNLRFSEKKYRALIESSSDPIYMIDSSLTILAANPQLAKVTGKPDGFVTVGKRLYEVLSKKHLDPFRLEIEEVFRTGMQKIVTNEIEISTGQPFWYSTSLSPVKDENDDIVLYVIVIVRDITIHMKTEEIIRKNEEKYRFFLENFPGIIYRADLNNKLEFIFGELEFLTGYTREELSKPGFNFQDIIYRLDVQRMVKAYRELVIGEVDEVSINFRVVCRNGSIKNLRGWFQKTRDDGNNSEAIQGVLYDYTSETETNDRIMDAVIETEERERLRFSEDLHDELGPMLSSIRMYINTIQSKNKPEQERERMLLLEQSIGLIDDAISQARNISRNLTPELLSDFGLVSAIKSFCNQVNSGRTVSIDLQLQNVDEDFRFNNLAELALFRVLKELISNTLKHAGASNIIIKFTQRRKMFLVEYFDDGVGFDFKTSLKKKGSLGLKNIVNRIGTVGGSIRFSTTADGGSMTLIEVSTEENTFHSGGITDV